MLKPLVSVIIATHNRAALLKDALESVYAQRGTTTQFDIEVVVVDDASTDATPRVAGRYPALRYVRLERNLGLPAARNVGLRASSGQYVAFLDDDDLWLPHKLSVQVPVLEGDPAVDVVYSQLVVREGNREFLWPAAERAPTGWIFPDMLMDSLAGPGSVLVRRESFDVAGYFNEDLSTSDDYDMWLRLAYHVRFKFLPGPVAVYRRSLGGRFAVAASSGYLEATLRDIVDKGLAMLGDTAETASLRRRAHAQVSLRVAAQLSAVGKIEWIPTHVLAAMQECPELVSDQQARKAIAWRVRSAALESDLPIDVVKRFCSDARRLTISRSFGHRLAMRRLAGRIWAHVAFGLALATPARASAAAAAAARALLCDPFILSRSGWWLLNWRRGFRRVKPTLQSGIELH